MSIDYLCLSTIPTDCSYDGYKNYIEIVLKKMGTIFVPFNIIKKNHSVTQTLNMLCYALIEKVLTVFDMESQTIANESKPLC